MDIGFSNLQARDAYGNTRLHQYLAQGEVDKALELLDDITRTGNAELLNIQNFQGDTPLHIAVRNYPMNKVSNLLITLGADPNIKNKSGEYIKIAKTVEEYYKNTKTTLPSISLSIFSFSTEHKNDFPSEVSIVPLSETFPNTITIESMKKPSDMSERSVSFPNEITIESMKKPSDSLTFPSEISIIEPNLATEEEVKQSLETKKKTDQLAQLFFGDVLKSKK